MISFKNKIISRLPFCGVVAVFVLQSCGGSNNQEELPRDSVEFATYKLFEEPSSQHIGDLKFYFLAAAYGSAENTQLLSIRVENNNSIYGYYKTIDRDLMPPIGKGFKTDTFPFIYSSTYFRLNAFDVDTLRKLIQNYQIAQLRDTLEAGQIGGRSREIVIFDSGKFYNIYRNFGNEASIEKEFAQFFDTVLKRLTPPPPLPSFRR